MSHGIKASEISHLPEEALTPQQAKRAALTRLLESVAFRRSPRLREFLEYVGTLSLEGRDEEITEQQIGSAVFQRGAQFNPAEDNIVRATARALRTKLREYYASEGAADPYRIEIPKGSYVAQFLLAQDIHPPGNFATRVALSGAARRRELLLLLGFGVAVILCLWLAWQNASLRRQQPGNPVVARTSESLLGLLLAENCNVTVIASDALHTRLQSARGSVTNLEEYTSKRVFSIPPPALSHSPDLWALIGEEAHTQGDDVRAAVQLARSIGPSCDVKLSHARRVTMNTFQRGGDFLILAGRRANPWAGLFEKDLNFEMIFPNASDSAIFLNRKPRPGERAEYRTVLNNNQTGVAYGRVAVMPGLYGSGRVVLVAGTSGETTFAATDFLTQPRGLEELRRLLGHDIDASLDRLEVLIETSAIGGGTRDFKIVAVR